MNSNSFKRVKKAIEDIKQGKMIIMTDDEDRENEGDIVYSAQFSTPQKVNFCATYAKGLICVAMSKESAKRLELNPMVQSNTSSYETAFTISVDSKNAKTGISAYERDETIKILANRLSKPDDLVKPGHIFPLIAKDGGVLVRTGHTEGSVDICKLAGLSGEAVICEIMNDDGSMARRDDLNKFAKKHNLNQVYISDIVEYRLAYESLIKQISEKDDIFLGKKVIKKEFIDHLNHKHYAIIFKDIKDKANVKFHLIDKDINIFFGNRLGEFIDSIEILDKDGGVLILLSSQKNEKKDEFKDFGIGAQILHKLGLKTIRLLSSSKTYKFIALKGFGIIIK